MSRTSSMLTTAALIVLGGLVSSCAFLIPPDPNMPRNNTVIGDPHRPQLNQNGGAPAMKPQASLPAPTMAAMPMPQASPAPVAQQQAMLAPAPVPPQYRSVPVENEQPLQLAGNYPPIDAVPPRPAMDGPDSSRQHLKDARSELESARDAAASSKAQLEHDAAGEPSMTGVAPASPVPNTSPPVSATPTGSAKPEQPTSSPSSNAAPSQTQTPVAQASPVVVANAQRLPANSQFAPPTPKSGMVPATKSKAPESLMGRPLPTASASPTKTAFADIALKQGDFNPLAEDDAAAAANGASATSGR